MAYCCCRPRAATLTALSPMNASPSCGYFWLLPLSRLSCPSCWPAPSPIPCANYPKQPFGCAMELNRGLKFLIFPPGQDEVGNLSTALRSMTNSLYSRIEAIEKFAADVSHELKNPLTSLRSAVETLPLANNPTSKKRLMDVIKHDVIRLDRLITDISDASRLDADLVRDDTTIFDMSELMAMWLRQIRRSEQRAAN